MSDFLTVRSAVRVGSTLIPASVRVDLLRRLPNMVIVGVPENQGRTLVELIRSAFSTCGIDLPRVRIVFTVTVEGENPPTVFDAHGLAMALCAALLPKGKPLEAIYYGTLALDGGFTTPRGVLGAARLAGALGLPLVTGTPELSSGWAPVRLQNEVLGAFTASPVYSVVSLAELSRPVLVDGASQTKIVPTRPTFDFRDVVGLDTAIQALALAARTRTPAVLRGPDGVGKSMLAARALGLLPDLTVEDAADAAIVHEAAGLGGGAPGSGTFSVTRPFRAPHHTVSPAGMVGNAAGAPGEVALAHAGVLFLDDYPEVPRAVLEAIGEPVTTGEIKVRTMGGYTCRFPSRVWLIVGVKTCPCGRAGSLSGRCFCSPEMIAVYERRWKGSPLLQGAMVIDVAPVLPEVLLAQQGKGRTTESYRIEAADKPLS